MAYVDKRQTIAAADKNESYDLAFYKFIINSLPVAVLTVDADYKITGFNPRAEDITGYSEEEALGHYCGALLKGTMCEFNCPLKGVLKHKKPVSQMETTICNKQGGLLQVGMNTAGLFDDEGCLIGGVEAFHDISRLKAMEREKDNLIYMFAHDMKSSITIIGGFALRLLRKATSMKEERWTKYHEIIKNESANLEFLVEDFLEFAHLQTGKLKLDFGPTYLERELIELLEAFQVKAKQSGIHLEFETDDALPVIHADAQRLRRVFANLLDNAFKFSESKGKVTLSTHQTEKDVIVRIEDQGRGIDPRDLPHIFDAFHRGKGTRKDEGSGVGLAAVKAIVEGHGGRIRVESELRKGSIFTIVLPKSVDQG